MKTLQIFALILITLFIASCNKSQDEATGVGDAIIVSKKSGENVVYAYSLYAYSFSPFQSVKAVNSLNASKTYTLKINQTYDTNFYYEIPDTDFTPTKPTVSVFNFSAVFENGATNEFQDEVTDKVLTVPVIKKTEYIATSKELGVNWASVTDADSYAINIFDGSNLVYSSPELVNSLEYFAVGTSGGWIKDYPVAGKAYTVRLLAFLYEPSGNSYNIQAVSMADTDKPIVWGN